MNGKIKYGFLLLLICGFISISANVSAFADYIVPTSIPDNITAPITEAQFKELIVLGTIAQSINNGTVYNFTDYDNTYSNFIDDVYNIAPVSMWERYYQNIADSINQFVDNVDNPVMTWINNALTGRSVCYGPAYQWSNRLNALAQFQEVEEEPTFAEPDYQIYLDRINKRDLNPSNFFFSDYGSFRINGSIGCQVLNYYPFTDYSWLAISGGTFQSVTDFTTPYMYCIDLHSIYITSNNGLYMYNETVTNSKTNWVRTYRPEPFQQYGLYRSFKINANSYDGSNNVGSNSFTLSITGTLEQVLDYVSKYWKNCNIYVDNLPWYMVSSNTPSTVYVDPNGMKYENTDVNVKINLPSGTYFDYELMKQIIQDAINNKDVLKYSDIEDVFVDEDGQTAVAVYVVNQNPTDIDIDIQYPSGTPDFSQFEESFTTISNDTPPAIYLIELVAMVMPDELWELLLFGGVLFLFVFLIKRMLE